MNSQVIPLFPLQMVVFPTEPVPLHIFEPRYRSMIGDVEAAAALGDFAEFGIVYSDGTGKSNVGCALEMSHVLERFDDGRINLIATGTRRFRVLEVHQDKAYATATVEWLNDTSADWDEDLANQVYKLHRALLQVVNGRAPEDDAYSGLQALSYTVASAAGLDSSTRQWFLEQCSEDVRLRRLADHLSILLPELKTALAIRQDIEQKWQLRSFEPE